MANSIYNQLNSNNNNINNNFLGFQNPNMLINQFNNFKNNLQGNPQQIVQQLLQSGQMSQSDYNNLRQMAYNFMKMLPK